jgi:aspartyl-tRNA(Asn)/glutamyl-tRNA(Gln) amidotransferase subunit B
VEASLPELPARQRARYAGMGLDAKTASMLGGDADLGDVFDAAIAAGADPRAVGNWLTGDVVAFLRRESLDLGATALTAAHLAELSAMVTGGDLSATAAKEVLERVIAGEGAPSEVAKDQDLIQISDVAAIEAAVDGVLAANAEAMQRMRDGDMKPLGFLVGQVMRATGGKADPRLVSDLLRRKAGG